MKRTYLLLVLGLAAAATTALVVAGTNTHVSSEAADADQVSSALSRASRGRLDPVRLVALGLRFTSKAELREEIERERGQVEIRRRAVARVTAQIAELPAHADTQTLDTRKQMAKQALELHERRLTQLEELLADPTSLTSISKGAAEQ